MDHDLAALRRLADEKSPLTSHERDVLLEANDRALMDLQIIIRRAAS